MYFIDLQHLSGYSYARNIACFPDWAHVGTGFLLFVKTILRALKGLYGDRHKGHYSCYNLF